MIFEWDLALFRAINGLAGKSEVFDSLLVFVSSSYVLKGIPVAMVWWGLWFHKTYGTEANRVKLLSTVVVALLAILVGRALAIFLPFRYRPIHDPEQEVSIPLGMIPGVLDGWSSIPSDHAVLFFALAASLFFVHRLIGLILGIHALVMVGMPRVFIGVHYPSDIVVGALVGILMVILLQNPVNTRIKQYELTKFSETQAWIFYPFMFLVTFQIASMFDSGRQLMSLALNLFFQMIS